MFKSYYASVLIAVGAALLIAAPENWMLQIVAYALLSGGAGAAKALKEKRRADNMTHIIFFI